MAKAVKDNGWAIHGNAGHDFEQHGAGTGFPAAPAASTAEEWGMAALARILGKSVRTLERLFEKHHHTTPRLWLADMRFWEARELLEKGCLVKQVASDLDFRHSSNFCRAFHKYFGFYPSTVAQPQKVQAVAKGQSIVAK